MDWRVAGVALIALTAGCGGLLGEDRSTDAFTPAPVPETTPSAEDPNRIAPGVGPGGVSDVNRLASAHADAIEGTSYEWRHREASRSTRVNYTVPITRTQGLRVEGERRYLYRTDSRSVDTQRGRRYFGNYTEYADGETRYQRYVGLNTGGNRSYERRDAVGVTSRFGVEATESIRRFLDVESASVTRVDVGDERLYELVGVTDGVGGIGPVRNYEVRAVISADGFIRSLRATFHAPQRQRRYAHQFAYAEIGTTTVDAPEWATERWDVNETDRSA